MEKKTVVIVGAGMGGLTAAAYLARENYNVVLLDKNDRVGGLVSTFEYEGFCFDAGPRAFVNSGMVKPMLSELGIEADYLDNKLALGFEDHLLSIESMASITEYERILKALYPENGSEIDEIIAAIKKFSGYTAVLYEFDNPNFTNITSDLKLVLKSLLPWTIKLILALRKMDKYNLPMEEYLGRITDNRSLTDIVTQIFFRETPTHFALGYFYVYLDYFYLKGGTGTLANLVKEKILRDGGDIQLRTQIVDVSPAASKVTDSAGKSYSYDHLIWAADLKTLYRNVNTTGLNAQTVQAIEAKSQVVLSSRGAESIFILFLGVNRPLSFFEQRGGEHMFYTPSRQGLGETNRGQMQDLIDNFDTRSREDIEAWMDEFCNRNTYEVSVPALRDRSLAPEGQSGVMISFLFDYALVKKIAEAGWYDAFKEGMENRIIRIFSETVYEGWADDVLFKFSSTPLTINRTSGSSEGAITGWSFETEIPVVNTLKDIAKSVLTPVPGVLQAGQWAYSPSGVPIAMLTGWYATREIIKQAKKR